MILSTGGGLPQCKLGCQPPPPDQAHHPPGPGTPPTRTRHTPLDQAHHHPPGPGTPPRPDPPNPPGTRPPTHPPDQTPRDQTPPGTRPPRETDASIRSMSGRYASYWNAFLFFYFFVFLVLSNVDVTNRSYGTKWRCSHGNGIFKTQNCHCCHSVNLFGLR